MGGGLKRLRAPGCWKEGPLDSAFPQPFLLYCFSLLVPVCSALVTGCPLRPRGPGTATPSSPARGLQRLSSLKVWWPGDSSGWLLDSDPGGSLCPCFWVGEGWDGKIFLGKEFGVLPTEVPGRDRVLLGLIRTGRALGEEVLGRFLGQELYAGTSEMAGTQSELGSSLLTLAGYAVRRRWVQRSQDSALPLPPPPGWL